jgi:hypothetical protein
MYILGPPNLQILSLLSLYGHPGRQIILLAALIEHEGSHHSQVGAQVQALPYLQTFTRVIQRAHDCSIHDVRVGATIISPTLITCSKYKI